MVDEHYQTILLVFQRITTSTLRLLQNSKSFFVILAYLSTESYVGNNRSISPPLREGNSLCAPPQPTPLPRRSVSSSSSDNVGMRTLLFFGNLRKAVCVFCFLQNNWKIKIQTLCFLGSVPSKSFVCFQMVSCSVKRILLFHLLIYIYLFAISLSQAFRLWGAAKSLVFFLARPIFLSRPTN